MNTLPVIEKSVICVQVRWWGFQYRIYVKGIFKTCYVNMIAQQVGKEVFNDQIGSLNANRMWIFKEYLWLQLQSSSLNTCAVILRLLINVLGCDPVNNNIASIL